MPDWQSTDVGWLVRLSGGAEVVVLQLWRGQVRHMRVSSTPPPLSGRAASVIAATLIGIGLSVLAYQVIGLRGPGVFFLALGAGFFAAYLNQRDAASALVVPAGILLGLGLGGVLAAAPLTPGFVHPPFFFGSLALGFGVIYAFGERRYHRWAMWPGAACGVLAWLTLAVSTPWLKDLYGNVAHVFWPLVLVGGGLWLIERGRRRDRSMV
jgi:hypothetical protein